MVGSLVLNKNYTIPSNNRELQLATHTPIHSKNYTIPSNNRELQPLEAICGMLGIIPYQVITGNYSKVAHKIAELFIIPYQVITGNYSVSP